MIYRKIFITFNVGLHCQCYLIKGRNGFMVISVNGFVANITKRNLMQRNENVILEY